MFRWYEPVLSDLFIPLRGRKAFEILEAMARGCVVFATGIPSTKGLSEINRMILLTGTGPESDVAILKLYENIEQIKRMQCLPGNMLKKQNRTLRKENGKSVTGVGMENAKSETGTGVENGKCEIRNRNRSRSMKIRNRIGISVLFLFG